MRVEVKWIGVRSDRLMAKGTKSGNKSGEIMQSWTIK